jgi:hypothetical protein
MIKKKRYRAGQKSDVWKLAGDLMAKTMKMCTGILIGLTVLCAVLYGYTRMELFCVSAITLGTAAYHFAMRLAFGTVMHLLLRNRVDYRAKWFQVSAAEKKLYKKLNVQKWKAKMPTYAPDTFDRKRHSWDEIAQAMCQAELVHEGIIVLSFVPVLGAISFGAVWVFVITSFLAACIDLAFVIMQRYNRPRVLKTIEKTAAGSTGK